MRTRHPFFRLSILSILFAVAVVLPSFAADQNGSFVVKGVGTQTCADFVETAKQGSRELSQYLGFINGYTSAFNEMNDKTFDVWRWQTTDTILLLLLRRCDRQPEINFGAALATLTRYFFESRIESNVPVKRVGNEDKGFFLYEPVYAELEALLQKEGYDTKDLYAALMQYKADNQLPTAKNLHQMLLLRLFSQQNR